MTVEKDLLFFLQTHRCDACDRLFIFLTEYVSVVTALVLLWAAYRVYVRKVWSPRLLGYWLLALALTAAMVHLLKWAVDRPRPYQVYQALHKMVPAGQGSFPSGHTAEVFTLWWAMWWSGISKKWLGLWGVWALFIAYTRMTFGAHYPSDIVGGIAVAWLGAWLARFLIFKYRKK